MFPIRYRPYQLKAGHYVYAIGRWMEIVSVGKNDGFKTSFMMREKGSEPKEIILNNQQKFEVKIKGLLT